MNMCFVFDLFWANVYL